MGGESDEEGEEVGKGEWAAAERKKRKQMHA